MFHHTHAYLASKLYRSEDPLLFVGAILPDLAVMKIIPWEGGLHGKKENKFFYQFIQANYSKYLVLAKGVNAHNIVDDFTHLDYPGGKGYAFQNNLELTKLAKEFYGVDKKRALSIAHNYIESAVDILLLNDYSEIQSQIRKATHDVNRIEISKILATYFKIDQARSLNALSDFWELFTKYDFVSQGSWSLFWGDLEILLSLKSVGNKKREILLKRALDINKERFKDFLDYCLNEGAKMI